MTGFGLAELKTSHGFIRVEIKTINHKFLELSTRLPGFLAEFEDAVRKTLSDKIRRGKIMIFISSPDPSTFSSKLVLNEPLAKEVFAKIRRVESILDLENKISSDAALREVLHYPDVLTKDAGAFKKSVYSKELFRAIAKAIEELNKSKNFEGRSLEKDFRKRLIEMKASLKTIEKRIPLIAKEYRKSLARRMKDFLKDGQVDRDRLTQDVAQHVKNSDISEEVTRLKSHIEGMQKALGENGEVGRKIDFIGQEMLRETNTIGSKSSDVAVANAVIALKSTIEKIREQSQNVE